MAAINPDLLRERKSAEFDVEKLTEVIHGGKQNVRRKRYLQNIILLDKYIQSMKPWWNRTRQEDYDIGVKKAVYINKLVKDLNITSGLDQFYIRDLDKSTENIILQDKYIQSMKPWWNRTREEDYDVGVKKAVYINKLVKDLNITSGLDQFYIRESAGPHENNPLGLHQVMFIPTIEKQGTKEQIEKYGGPAKRYEIIGTYSQTELGHGTFIRGLETTATYDPKTEEFVLNSPTLTSMKYWPGSLGKTVTHTILMAQLYTGGKCHGLHTFVVQLRSLENHQPLPGVTVGDIGNKMGYSGMDNGFLMFDNYRVPRDALLMRYAKVERDGTYTPPQNMKIAYGSMVYIRALIVGDAARSLAQSCVIATRYSAVRRQTEIRPGGEEPQVLDYQTQQEKLFPLMAASYALMFTGNTMVQEYTRITANIEKGNMEEMQVLHALASGLKALASDIASDGIDVLRKSCGGHGYTHASGIPKIWMNITPACTYEGENTVMYLQCGRYLVKCFALAASGKQLPGFMQYLNNPVKPRSSLDSTLSLDSLVEAYEHMTARLVKVAATRMQTLMKAGAPQEVARNQSGVLLVKAAMAHSRTFVVKTFAKVATASSLDQNVSKVLQTLCKLFAVSGIIAKMGDFIQDGFVTSQQAEMLVNKQLDLYAQIRPNAVALVDAFDYPDHVLQSCLGRNDGNVYQALYEYAQGSPLNTNDVMDSYYTTLKPLMNGELFKEVPNARL